MADFQTLLDGYRRFRHLGYAKQRERYDQLAHGQSPKIMIIACSDSRVDPSLIFDVEPGQIFMLRNVANLVPPYSPDGGLHGVSAAVEFAVTMLKVEHILVMGHGRCGGVQACLGKTYDQQGGEYSFIGQWISMIKPVRDKLLIAHSADPEVDMQTRLEQATVELSLANLETFPFVKQRIIDKSLTLQGGFFDISDGQLKIRNPETGHFTDVQNS